LVEPSSDDEFAFENEGESEDLEEAEEKDNQDDLFKWTSQQPSFILDKCTRTEGVHKQGLNRANELTLLQLFLTTEMMRLFVNYTNEYAENYNNNNNSDNNNNVEEVEEILYASEDDSELSSSSSDEDIEIKRIKSHMKPWYETTENELWIFFGIQIIMGIINLPSTKDYWSKEFRVPLVANSMTRDRFLLLLKFFRVVPLSDTNPSPPPPLSILLNSTHHLTSSSSILGQNNHIPPLSNFSNSPPSSHALIPHTSSNVFASSIPLNSTHFFTPLPHVNRLVIDLNINFGKYLTPGSQLAYDESMVDFQGYSTIRQYMKGKPHPWGYKILCLVYNKYVISFEIYGGKRKETDPPPSELGTTGDAVVRLMERAKVVGFNHIVFLDSWFNSPLLVKRLNELGIRTCGAVKSQRKHLPKCPRVPCGNKTKEDPNSPLSKVKLKQMQPGDFFQFYSGNITYLVVKDKTLMKLLYNHIPGCCTIGREMVNKEVKMVPLALQHYCTYARGVDIINQLHYQYIIGRKSKRCWPRLVWWLLELCIINAFYLWKKYQEKGGHKKFRLLLIKQILYKYNSTSVSSPTDTLELSNNIEHRLVLSSVERDCSVCSVRKSSRVQTQYMCISCNEYMCASTCYDMHRKTA
jgi:hypothetical protein